VSKTDWRSGFADKLWLNYDGLDPAYEKEYLRPYATALKAGSVKINRMRTSLLFGFFQILVFRFIILRSITGVIMPFLPHTMTEFPFKLIHSLFVGPAVKLTFNDGSFKTLGIMLPGEYEFNTEAEELMEIAAGKLTILIAGETAWQDITGGMSFKVPANSSFKLKVNKVTDYCCSYG
jgi:uncharacterized protein YaiE (UPF0345 family)